MREKKVQKSWIERKLRKFLFGKEDGNLDYAVSEGVKIGLKNADKFGKR
jgi:hypothetical protein